MFGSLLTNIRFDLLQWFSKKELTQRNRLPPPSRLTLTRRKKSLNQRSTRFQLHHLKQQRLILQQLPAIPTDLYVSSRLLCLRLTHAANPSQLLTVKNLLHTLNWYTNHWQTQSHTTFSPFIQHLFLWSNRLQPYAQHQTTDTVHKHQQAQHYSTTRIVQSTPFLLLLCLRPPTRQREEHRTPIWRKGSWNMAPLQIWVRKLCEISTNSS